MKYVIATAILAVPCLLAAQTVEPPKIPLMVDADQMAVPHNPRPEESEGAKTPKCDCQAQCEAMWARAPDAIESASGMRTRIATKGFLETYAPTRRMFGMLAGRVTRTPKGDGGYYFDARFDGQDPSDSAHERVALRSFNLALNSAGMGIECPKEAK